MDLRFSSEDIAFRHEVREFLRASLPPDIAAKVRANQCLDRAGIMRWQDILAARGWLATGWPKEYGGPGFSATQRYLFEQEYGALPCPPPVQFGITMAGPVIYTYGSEAQKARFLPPIRENKVWWCQGYSEPGAGSDLAALRTRAVRDREGFVVTGQKIWTTGANWADWMFCLVKTDIAAKPQAAISFLLIDMRSPGIVVRPIRTLDGDCEINEVFLDEVRVPEANLVGEEGRGWTYAKFLLEHERFSMSGAARSRRQLGELRDFVAARGDRAGAVARLAAIDIELRALEMIELRLLSRLNAGGNPGPETSKLKIRGTEIAQAIARLRLDLCGSSALRWDRAAIAGEQPVAPGAQTSATALTTWLNLRKLTIWGGSNEIQRNVLARAVLGL
ncbi:MAG: acyl-CoA dehydrogenase family protein [Burkholderiaceae bacterium]|nr:acyl-CoA dehydrogenase family protein [Burkholderiaceae bacterium]